MPGLPHPDRVEEARYRYRQSTLMMIGQAKEFVDHLASGVSPSGAGSTPKHDIVILSERDADPLTIDLRRASDNNSASVQKPRPQHRLSTHDVGLNRVHWLLDDQFYADRRSEMNYQRSFRRQPVDNNSIVDIGMDEAKSWMVKQMRDVRSTSSAEIVNRNHSIAFPQEGFSQVRADESSSSSYYAVSGRTVGGIHNRVPGPVDCRI